jgi:uroporphyrinogen-III decarboxylase
VQKHFGQLPLGGQESETCSLSGYMGSCLLAELFGIDIEFFENNWPSARSNYLSKSEISKMERLDIQKTHGFEDLTAQIDLIESKFGKIHGFLNPQGITNNALRLRGNDLMLDVYDDPSFVHHLFNLVCNAITDTIKYFQFRQRKSGVDLNFLTVSNCTVNMFGSSIYENFILPYDKKLCSAFNLFGLHNCAWTINPYIDLYSKIGQLSYIDMGLDSDFKRIRDVYPNTRRAVMYTPTDLVNKSIEKIRLDISRIYNELSPCDIVLADIETGTPDQRVLDFVNLTKLMQKQSH